MDAPVNRQDRKYILWAAAALGCLLVFRLVILALNPLGLHGDEAQYWAWSQDLAFGYYSKPPLIAWIIAATTSVFGDAEWAVRLASPWLHLGTTVLTYLTA
ncbi:MAG: glycosyltransferase family 39 protein, partial [Pseudomonadota bacterium]